MMIGAAHFSRNYRAAELIISARGEDSYTTLS